MVLHSSNRKFVVFSYSVGHGELLLRSGKMHDPLNENRITILFKDIIAPECRAAFNGLILNEESFDFLKNKKQA